MKKLITLILFVLLASFNNFSQVPEKINYQAVIRNSTGELVASQDVGLKVSILNETSTGSVLYTEEHTVATNAYGQVAIQIGEGTNVSGEFNAIDWGVSDKFLKLEVDIDGGTSYVPVGTSQMLSVPYALFAKNADSSRVAGMAYTAGIADVLGSEGVYTTSTDTLFVVKDHDGNVVFAVFPDGAQIIVNEAAKGKVGGFAVSGRSPSKAVDVDILKVTTDSTRIYVNDTVNAKGKVGGFAVSGRSPAKNVNTDILFVTADSTRIYVKDTVAGFGIANIESGVAENFLNLNKQNYLIGHQTGRNTTGIYNSMIGYQAGLTNSSGSNNIFFGYKAGYLNQSGGNNVFIGTESGYVNQFTFQNTYVGYRSGYDLSGAGNTVMGSMAGENAGGGNNTFIGTSAGRIATGGNNTFVGNGAGYGFPTENTGLRNTYIGQASGAKTTTGSYNVMLGFDAGYLNYEGSRNTFIGYDAGHNIHEGSGNVFIGHEAGYYADGINNRLIIDNANMDSTDVLFYGEFDQNHLRINGNVGINYQAYNSYGLIVDIPDGQTSIYTLLIYGNAWASGGTWSTSDERFKKNITTYENALNTIMQFRGVSYDWRVDEFPQQRFSDGRQLGFIAQEVEKIAPNLVKEGPNGYKGVEYTKFTPIIVEALKEQQNQIEKLKAENEDLQQRLKHLEELILK
ncbi:MAG: hypothetical protein GQ564_17405 [Bacteroidales bacterium]|nr:hypothetical protein [Bacteroidales bacterium]